MSPPITFRILKSLYFAKIYRNNGRNCSKQCNLVGGLMSPLYEYVFFQLPGKWKFVRHLFYWGRVSLESAMNLPL